MSQQANRPGAAGEAESSVADLREKMLAKKFWLVITKPVASPEEVAKHMRAHLLNQIRLEKEGILFGAGPVHDENGNVLHGMLILRASSAAEAREIADSDPMHRAGVRQYTLQQWTMNEGRMILTIDASDSSYRLS